MGSRTLLPFSPSCRRRASSAMGEGAAEWARLRGRSLDILMWGFGVVLALLGLRAVAAVVLS